MSSPVVTSKPTGADLLSTAHRLYEFVRTEAGEVYGVALNGPRIALPVGKVFDAVSAYMYGQGRDLPSKDAAVAAGSALYAHVEQTADVSPVDLRIAHRDGLSYLDLGTPDGTFVEIGPSGWRIRTQPTDRQYDLAGKLRAKAASTDSPDERSTLAAKADDLTARPTGVLFRRSATTTPLPMPQPGGNRADLARLLALSTDDPRWRMAYGWLVAQFLPDSARPILWMLGSQGSGKTTRGLLLANMLEPQDEMGGVLKRTERENNPVAKASFILTADNMTKLSEDVSNWLCSLVTGVRVVERRLYTNDDTVAYSIKRSGIFTGKVMPAGLEADAQERMLVLKFGRMREGIRSDVDLLAEFRELHPRLLGALLDDVYRVLRLLPSITAADVQRYRFVDYGRVHVALDRIIGPGFLSAIVDATRSVLAERVHDSPDLAALLAVLADAGGSFRGTSLDLLGKLAAYRPDDRDVWWPKTAMQLGTRLRHQQHALASVGLDIEFTRSTTARVLAITLADPTTAPDMSPAAFDQAIRGPR